jgi:hypothetical protein
MLMHTTHSNGCLSSKFEASMKSWWMQSMDPNRLVIFWSQEAIDTWVKLNYSEDHLVRIAWEKLVIATTDDDNDCPFECELFDEISIRNIVFPNLSSLPVSDNPISIVFAGKSRFNSSKRLCAILDSLCVRRLVL